MPRRCCSRRAASELCSRARRARSPPTKSSRAVTAPMMLGQLVDRVVASYVLTGTMPRSRSSTRSASLRAERDERALAWLDTADTDVIRELRADLADRAARVESSWPAGAVGVVATSRRSGAHPVRRRTARALGTVRRDARRACDPAGASDHRDQGREQRPLSTNPTSTGTGCSGHCATASRPASLRSGPRPTGSPRPHRSRPTRCAPPAMRVVAAAERWVELLSGREPTLTAHPGCRWCALLEVCETGQRWSPDGDDRRRRLG